MHARELKGLEIAEIDPTVDEKLLKQESIKTKTCVPKQRMKKKIKQMNYY
jgi:hypothetical protein